MKDVAKAANVSIQTVSAVVNGKPEITLETRERVLSTIKRLGYRPYTVARSLRTRSTNTLALILSDITNPFFATIVSIAEDYAHSAGYSLILYNTHYDPERERYYCQAVLERWIDGLLFVSTFDHANGLEIVQAAGVPVVVLDRIPDGYSGPAVTLDNVKAGRLAAGHLLELGHTQFAHISGPLDLRLSRERLQGFQETIRAQGLDPGPSVTGDSNWSGASGYNAMKELLALPARPTAVFAANDRMAIGAMRAIAEAGLRIPGDISVVGVDDIELAALHNPSLTTVAQSLADVATQAINILLEILRGKDHTDTRVILDAALKVRESTAAPPRAR